MIRDEGAPDVPPPGRVGAVGIGNGPAILSKFMVSSFKMSVLDKARLYWRVTTHYNSGEVAGFFRGRVRYGSYRGRAECVRFNTLDLLVRFSEVRTIHV